MIKGLLKQLLIFDIAFNSALNPRDLREKILYCLALFPADLLRQFAILRVVDIRKFPARMTKNGYPKKLNSFERLPI